MLWPLKTLSFFTIAPPDMEPDQQLWPLDQYLFSFSQSIPVDCSSTSSPLGFEFSDSNFSSPTNGPTSPIHPRAQELCPNSQVGENQWNSSDQVQLPPSPSCSVQCLDIDTRCAHGLKADIPILPPGPYLVIQEEFCNAPWRRAGELEPTDPTTGRSVLYTLLEEFTSRNKRHTSKCRLCNKAFTRADRAITHLRHEHLDHRPFRCEGSCGTNGCQQCFHSQENLAPHVKPKKVVCPHCQHKCHRQNMTRHIKKYHIHGAT